MILPNIDRRLNPLKTTFNMKYIVAVVLGIIIFFICLPVWVITWDWDHRTNGWGDVVDGLEKMLGID
jgi:hypothetical protein